MVTSPNMLTVNQVFTLGFTNHFDLYQCKLFYHNIDMYICQIAITKSVFIMGHYIDIGVGQIDIQWRFGNFGYHFLDDLTRDRLELEIASTWL